MSYSKYYLYKKQYSEDGGVTWSDVEPIEKVTSGESIGTYNTLVECETPPAPTFQGKWLATYSDSYTSSAECDASSAITKYEIALTDLVSIQIGDCVIRISGSAFDDCSSLSSVTIPNSVTRIDNYAFQYCYSLTSVTIPYGVTYIGNGVFNSCWNLKSINIPNGITSIGQQVFQGCSGLKSIIIPDGVTGIYYKAFYGCTGLTSVTVEATTPPTLGSNAFDNTNSCPIYVPNGSVNAYKTASGWSTYASRIQAIT